ncbi:major facilitator superfamily MFS_1 [Bifidobacterium actinocoloniiforme DSM 22766]|uniref:Major facilitator superfamily MFS_1 n=1 Tax=Bifidobacterium actinocoloniiforme DSM 22766 TaxID=1437605 RepID=A0A086Z1S2_9BIFI|nr:MFS transporter [Bifidobacterium actinocoloniiforme]AKV55582.1 MFS transporter [Bifidobacterium actinocoloniiforme DSM 22766]KFI40472.1 major facilitator superfamily MFS_1 [Bifidobacterium actinocoloniiforme DSM 22766]
MKKSLIALAAGAFALGAAEFVMMGILPQTAQAMNVSIPQAGRFISAYAIGVCVGALMLVFGRKTPPKRLIILFLALIVIGNGCSALSTSAIALTMSRFIAGLPHGAFFGTAAYIAKSTARPDKQAQAVAVTITGQTLANMLGVPGGTLLAEYLSWRAAFAFLAVWGAATILLSLRWLPNLPPVPDSGLRGQFHFLKRRGPWVILLAVFTGNAGLFCWWSYVSPWLTQAGGWSSSALSALMVLAGFGMVVGGLAGGALCDRWRHAGTAALGQTISFLGLVAIFLIPGSKLGSAILTFWVAFGLFFVSTPQQILMVDAGQGGGELIGGATIQVAFNLGNAVGSMLGGAALSATGMDYRFPALTGAPLALAAALLLLFYSHRLETKTDAVDRLQVVKV